MQGILFHGTCQIDCSKQIQPYFSHSHSATIAVAKILEFRVTRARVGTKAKDRDITQCLAAAPRFCNSVPI